MSLGVSGWIRPGSAGWFFGLSWDHSCIWLFGSCQLRVRWQLGLCFSFSSWLAQACFIGKGRKSKEEKGACMWPLWPGFVANVPPSIVFCWWKHAIDSEDGETDPTYLEKGTSVRWPRVRGQRRMGNWGCEYCWSTHIYSLSETFWLENFNFLKLD